MAAILESGPEGKPGGPASFRYDPDFFFSQVLWSKGAVVRGTRARLWAVALGACALALALPGAASAARATASAAWEPNDNIASATGPLQSGGVYQAAIETSNDQDWFVMYTTGVTQLNVSLLGLHPDGCFGPELRLLDASGETIEETGSVDDNETRQILYTVPGAETLYVTVEAYHLAPCAGPEAVYRLQVASSPALGLSPPPPVLPPPPATAPKPPPPPTGPAPACVRARNQIAQIRSRLADAVWPKQRRKLRRKLRAARRHARAVC
jgi:hypothetical protein